MGWIANEGQNRRRKKKVNPAKELEQSADRTLQSGQDCQADTNPSSGNGASETCSNLAGLHFF